MTRAIELCRPAAETVGVVEFWVPLDGSKVDVTSVEVIIEEPEFGEALEEAVSVELPDAIEVCVDTGVSPLEVELEVSNVGVSSTGRGAAARSEHVSTADELAVNMKHESITGWLSEDNLTQPLRR